MFCKNCGMKMNEQDSYCSNCGTAVQNGSFQQGATSQQPVSRPAPIAHTNKYDFLWILLGLIIPLAGFIIFLVWKDSNPKAAKYAGVGALITTCLGIFGIFILKIIASLFGLILRIILSPFSFY